MAAPITFSGIASGIDSDALIKATKEAATTQRIEPTKTKISELQDTNSKLTDLKSKLDKLKLLASERFSNSAGGGVSKQAESNNETVASALASNGATNGAYSLTVSAIAKNETVSLWSSTTYTSSTSRVDSALAGSDTLTVQVGALTAQVFTVNNTTTLDDLANQITAAFVGNLEASVINVGTSSSPDYRLVLNSSKTGVVDGSITVTAGATLTADSVFDNAHKAESDATNAVFTLAGVGTITRPTNNVADVVAGVTFNLKSAGSAKVTITNDEATTLSNLHDMIDAYNDVAAFVKDNNIISRDEDGEDVRVTFGPLSKTRIDEGAFSALRDQIHAAKITEPSATGTNRINIMADLGVETEKANGLLRINETIFKDALSVEPSSVDTILSSFATTISALAPAVPDPARPGYGTVDIYTGFNRLLDQVINANKEAVTRLNQQITNAQKSINKQEEMLRAQYARLEGNIGRMQQQQQSLSAALSGL